MQFAPLKGHGWYDFIYYLIFNRGYSSLSLLGFLSDKYLWFNKVIFDNRKHTGAIRYEFVLNLHRAFTRPSTDLHRTFTGPSINMVWVQQGFGDCGGKERRMIFYFLENNYLWHSKYSIGVIYTLLHTQIKIHKPWHTDYLKVKQASYLVH